MAVQAVPGRVSEARPRSERPIESMANFARVDDGATTDLIAMMDATDAWSAVRAARAWVLDLAGIDAGSLVLDVGCGPGTFGLAAARAGAVTVDADRSLAMLHEVRRRRIATRTDARAAVADVGGLPFRTGAAHLVRAERVLQWTDDSDAAIRELRRVTAADGWTAITDTDWSTLVVDHPDRSVTQRWTAAALGWVPNARVAPALPEALRATGASDVRARTDRMTISAWDPREPTQGDGPPGLPLRAIAAGGAASARADLTRDLEDFAARARAGSFSASLELVTVAATR